MELLGSPIRPFYGVGNSRRLHGTDLIWIAGGSSIIGAEDINGNPVANPSFVASYDAFTWYATSGTPFSSSPSHVASRYPLPFGGPPPGTTSQHLFNTSATNVLAYDPATGLTTYTSDPHDLRRVWGHRERNSRNRERINNVVHPHKCSHVEWGRKGVEEFGDQCSGRKREQRDQVDQA